MSGTQFESLSSRDRLDALSVAASLSGRRAHLLEKDVWVVRTLSALMESPFGGDLTFKGGTSLAKAYHVIRRFSEDLDITYDIRAIAPDLVEGHGDEALPPTRNQEQRWTRTIKKRLAEWVAGHATPTIEDSLSGLGLSARIRADGDRIFVVYEPLFSDYGFVRPEVMVEFGARSTGEPRKERQIECDAARLISTVEFPSVGAPVMLAERTFWEKATAVHVFCRQQRSRGERLSRHWYDLVRLDDAGFAEKSAIDFPLALAVARHKAIFFREKDAEGHLIDYEAALSGALQLVPRGGSYGALADDYGKMLSDGMLFDDEEQFDALMDRCAEIETRVNERMARLAIADE